MGAGGPQGALRTSCNVIARFLCSPAAGRHTRLQSWRRASGGHRGAGGVGVGAGPLRRRSAVGAAAQVAPGNFPAQFTLH